MSQAHPQSKRSFNPKFLLRALKYRNYRLFFSGQIVSLIGTWLTTVATSWLVYRLATTQGQTSLGSPALILGIVGFASQVPQLFLGPIAGVWVDRMSRHRILMITQGLSMLQSIALSVLALTHLITIPQIIALNVFQGFVNAFDMPARQSFVIEMVDDREDLSNAIALSSSMVHSARLIGPAVAGFLIYRLGEASCFIIDSFSYLAVLLALLSMKLKPAQQHKPAADVFQQMKEGLRYATSFGPIRSVLILTAVTSTLFMSLSTLLPIFADQILGGRERVYGFLLAASGLGALTGAIMLAARKSVLGLGKLIAFSNIILGISLLIFGLSNNLALSLTMLAISGFCLVSQVASCNTILQTIVETDKRGRVMSLFGMAFMGMAPIGSLIAGTLADQIGAPRMIGFAGSIIVLTGLIFSRNLPHLRKQVRPIYERLGLYGEIPHP